MADIVADPGVTPNVAEVAPPVHGYIDLHIHLAAHLAVPIYGDGPDRPPPDRQLSRHSLQPQIFMEQLSGPSIYLSLAYANPFNAEFISPAEMRAHIGRQLDAVDDLCASNAARIGCARTPEEARAVIASGRAAVVHGIEGATGILAGPEDARYWADRGVAVITPVHLADNAIGAAWCQARLMALLNLPGCRQERRDPEGRGLTAAGVERIHDLIDAGIVLDGAHTARPAFAQVMEIAEARGVAIVYTHTVPHAIRAGASALTDSELRRLYASGGLLGLTANAASLGPDPARPLPPDHCPGSVDDLRLHWDYLVGLLSGAPLGWGSDFQGGISHPRPKYGPRGCSAAPEDRAPDAFDLQGLAHAGLVDPMFARMGADGSEMRPLYGSAERFLQIWERARNVTPAKTSPPP